MPLEPPAPVGSILETIGATPLIPLRRVIAAGGAQVLGKLEAANPAGSVKDRIALSMIRAAEAQGVLRAGMSIVEPTSGNTGIALAMVAAALHYDIILTMPDHMSSERISVMAAYGAHIELTPSIRDMAGAIERAEQIVASDPDRYFMPQQFRNAANPQTHRESTALEILQTCERIDAFVTGVGTGGTISGVGAILKERRGSSVRVVAVEPARSAVLSGGVAAVHGIQGIGAGFVPEILQRDVIDDIVTVEDEAAFAMSRRLAREEGLLLGPSSGANVAVAADIAAGLAPDAVVVTLLCDTGFRYFSVDGFVEAKEQSVSAGA